MPGGVREWPIVTLRSALTATWSDLAAVGESLPDAAWALPSSCPGWTVQDVVAHVAGLESVLAGDPPPIDTLPPVVAHLTSGDDFNRAMEVMVNARRGWAASQLLTELRSVAARREQQLAEFDDDPATALPGPFGREMPQHRLLGIRVFDCYAHEQDFRRATGNDGNLDGICATISRDRIATGLAHVLPNALAWAGGARVVFDVDGWRYGMVLDSAAVVDDGSQGGDVVLRLSFDDLLRLGCGRLDARPAAVIFEGDEKLGRAIVTEMAITP